MSYCVHCGVKLKPAVRRCPLCDTPVFDPAELNLPTEDFRMEHVDTFPHERMNWPFVSRITLCVLASVAAVMALCDLLTTGCIGWSWYAAAGCALTAGFTAIPAVQHIFLRSVFPFFGIALALFLIAVPTGGMRWYLFLVLPITIVTAVYTAVSVWLVCRKKVKLFYRIALCLLMLVLSLIAVEICTDLYAENTVHLFWSLYAVVPLSFIAVFLTITARNHRIVEYIRKNMFVSPY